MFGVYLRALASVGAGMLVASILGKVIPTLVTEMQVGNNAGKLPNWFQAANKWWVLLVVLSAIVYVLANAVAEADV